ncbi:hypothetical protein ACLKA7_002381 [Drosophila subpalustris]
MRSNIILLSCALLALLIANLPMGEAVSCNLDPDNADCTDCNLAANAGNVDCMVWDTTTVSWEPTTERWHPRGQRGSRRGGRRGSQPVFNFFF